jgi:tetratricopeptide (TPR) repeat protein
MKETASLALCTLLLLLLLAPVSRQMQERPFVQRVGVIPNASVMRAITADQKQLFGALNVLKVLIYYGTSLEKTQTRRDISHDFSGMYPIIKTATRLDPYNMDAYYFAQAILVWDMHRIDEANALLDYGMRYRDWDFYLPFFAGFNHAYVRKDYRQAAQYYKKVGELTGSDLFVRLASRYMYEDNQTGLAIAYLKTMLRGERNEAIKKSFALRLEALETVQRIETASEAFQQREGHKPESVAELLRSGMLTKPVTDPYGGTFYLDQNGRVRTTSKFALPQATAQPPKPQEP